ncbi:hypothetical protein N5P37_011803 [Trichoderma harzianum]|uniref:AttH domain-containing protein n=1 Tax=Trichoderma harzianum CBS 226.95 TaxID=983964 RepID=A0A2T3ZR51_TRIHA|nr:hypothetical protein M431DRAFT_11875 [Trichoderma harzianum CBS 226.95]KAK0755648.1 hypothetical protein N5P37_011803 [Trichoderma harzianum]PTB47278.1 hypothetical protein M431DRAFT_11875 [Trichoderma harzianum CBS 226.95]
MKLLAKALLASRLVLATNGLRTRVTPNETRPSNIDGPYVTNPFPGPGNESFDWWWANVIGEEVNGIVPSIEVVLYEGFVFTRGPSDPSFQVDISGTLPNGTQFFIVIPADTATVTESEERVTAVWKDPSGETIASLLSTTGPPRTFDVSFNYPPLGISGSVSLVGTNTPPHTGCSGNTSGSRYFDPAIPAGANFNDAQTEFFTNLGWAIAMPGTTSAKVNIVLDGHSASFEGAGYHDKNWADKPIDQYLNTWLFGLGSCGPYHVAFVEAQPLNSPHKDDFMSGYLSFDTEILQSQCTTFSNLPYPKPNTFNFNISGTADSPAAGVNLPTNMFAEYVIHNGSRYQFDLNLLPGTPALPIYNRWRAVGKGGLVGGKQYDCTILGEWMNPGAVPYTDGANIFES